MQYGPADLQSYTRALHSSSKCMYIANLELLVELVELLDFICILSGDLSVFGTGDPPGPSSDVRPMVAHYGRR